MTGTRQQNKSPWIHANNEYFKDYMPDPRLLETCTARVLSTNNALYSALHDKYISRDEHLRKNANKALELFYEMLKLYVIKGISSKPAEYNGGATNASSHWDFDPVEYASAAPDDRSWSKVAKGGKAAKNQNNKGDGKGKDRKGDGK